jgi:hypothetical protein
MDPKTKNLLKPRSNSSNSLIKNYRSRDSNQVLIIEANNDNSLKTECCSGVDNCNMCLIF